MELIYLRKSQADNPNESVESVLERHEYQLQEFAEKELGYRIPEEQIYREVMSGETIEARVEVKKVLKQIESPDITAVIVIEPQRLGRGDLEDCGRLVNAFRYTNTKIMTPVKTYDLQEKYDRKFFEMELQRGSDYLEYYKEIQARGRRLSVKRGCYIGSVAPFGYKRVCIKDENNKKCWTLEEEPSEAPAIKMAFDLFVNHGYGFARVAHALDEAGYVPRKAKHFSPAAIKDMLENPIYIGKVRWDRRKTVKNITDGVLTASRPKNAPENYQIYDGLHKGIIDEETFHAALAKRGKGIRVRNKAKIRNPFAGLLYCECGHALIYQPYDRK
ncbi:MAG: recombinase family protein, partial [Lachnospiraceae bacterium]|nr:recombinase family protein [Lachnospiraceae bacterium]